MILIDTSVLVYSIDSREVQKQDLARKWLRSLREPGLAALPVQSLSELANVCLYRLQPRLTPSATAQLLDDLRAVYSVLPLTPAVVAEAVRGVDLHGFSYFDAQIWATAKLNQFTHVLTEDLPGSLNIEGIRYLNPFVDPPSLTEE